MSEHFEEILRAWVDVLRRYGVDDENVERVLMDVLGNPNMLTTSLNLESIEEVLDGVDFGRYGLDCEAADRLKEELMIEVMKVMCREIYKELTVCCAVDVVGFGSPLATDLESLKMLKLKRIKLEQYINEIINKLHEEIHFYQGFAGRNELTTIEDRIAEIISCRNHDLISKLQGAIEALSLEDVKEMLMSEDERRRRGSLRRIYKWVMEILKAFRDLKSVEHQTDMWIRRIATGLKS